MVWPCLIWSDRPDCWWQYFFLKSFIYTGKYNRSLVTCFHCNPVNNFRESQTTTAQAPGLAVSSRGWGGGGGGGLAVSSRGWGGGGVGVWGCGVGGGGVGVVGGGCGGGGVGGLLQGPVSQWSLRRNLLLFLPVSSIRRRSRLQWSLPLPRSPYHGWSVDMIGGSYDTSRGCQGNGHLASSWDCCQGNGHPH